jgi:hypothetical protein
MVQFQINIKSSVFPGYIRANLLCRYTFDVLQASVGLVLDFFDTSRAWLIEKISVFDTIYVYISCKCLHT